MLFQLALEIVGKVHGGHSWTAVEKQNDRQVPIPAPDQQELLITIHQ